MATPGKCAVIVASKQIHFWGENDTLTLRIITFSVCDYELKHS